MFLSATTEETFFDNRFPCFTSLQKSVFVFLFFKSNNQRSATKQYYTAVFSCAPPAHKKADENVLEILDFFG